MDGKMRYVLDTNAIIYILKNNADAILPELEQAERVAISVISLLEYSAFPEISAEDKALLHKFLSHVETIDLLSNNEILLQHILEVRQKYRKVKLPDAIIYGTALYLDAILLTNDKDLLKLRNTEKYT